jgi:Peptidase family M23
VTESIDGEQPPLTRREARAREAALAASAPPVPVPVPVPKKTLAHRRASKRAGRAVRTVATGPRHKSSLGSTFVSLGALVIAGALLVGSSLPINVLTTPSIATAASTVDSPGVVAGQTLRVSADAIDSAPVRDNFDVVSPAEVLALKFSGVDYAYTLTSGAVRWPLSSAIPITDGFGPRSGGFHKGVDFVPGEGSPIYAIADGVAVSAGYDTSGYGNHVVIQHNLGGVDVKSNYGHMILDSSPIVAGQQIKVGDYLGQVGDTGISYGAHLHFEIYVDDVPVDPYAWLSANASD